MAQKILIILLLFIGDAANAKSYREQVFEAAKIFVFTFHEKLSQMDTKEVEAKIAAHLKKQFNGKKFEKLREAGVKYGVGKHLERCAGILENFKSVLRRAAPAISIGTVAYAVYYKNRSVGEAIDESLDENMAFITAGAINPQKVREDTDRAVRIMADTNPSSLAAFIAKRESARK